MYPLLLLSLFGILTVAGTPTGSKTLPKCAENGDCVLCACCGTCDKDTDYKCIYRAGVDCRSQDIFVEKSSKMTPEERAAGSEFFRRAMSYMNDSYDWDRENQE